MNRQEILDKYASVLEGRGCKELTIQTRTGQAGRLLDRLQALGLATDPRSIGEREMRAVARAEDIKESTAYVYVHLLADLCEVYGNTAPRRVRILWNRTEPSVCWMTADDLRRLLKAAPPTERIALVLGAMAGMRASEIVNLKTSDIHGGTVTVIGKGHGRGKIAEQPIPPEVKTELARYLRWRSRQHPHTDRVIVWPGGIAYDGPSARVMLHRRLRRLGDSQGIDITPHALRRLYATTLLNNGTDIVTVSRLMRHGSTEVTMRYIARDRTREFEAVKGLANAFVF